MSHVEYLVHFVPICSALFLDGAEEGRNGEEVVFDYQAIVAYEVEHFRLCASRAMHHAVDVRTECIEQLLDHRRIRAGRREHQLAGIDGRAFYQVGQLQVSAVYQVFGHGVVVAFRIFLRQVFGEHIVACRGQPVASHAAVVFFFIRGLSVGGKSYDDIARADIGIVYHVGTLHAAGHGRVYDDGAHQVAHIGGFASRGIYAYTHFAQFGKQFIRTVDDGGDYLARYQQFVASDSGRDQYVVYRSHAEQVVDVHNQRVLCDAFPNREVACFLPV